jgi:hypothetical protein
LVRLFQSPWVQLGQVALPVKALADLAAVFRSALPAQFSILLVGLEVREALTSTAPHLVHLAAQVIQMAEMPMMLPITLLVAAEVAALVDRSVEAVHPGEMEQLLVMLVRLRMDSEQEVAGVAVTTQLDPGRLVQVVPGLPAF